MEDRRQDRCDHPFFIPKKQNRLKYFTLEKLWIPTYNHSVSSLNEIMRRHVDKNSKCIHTTSSTLTIDGWALTIWPQAMCRVAPLYVKDSWLRRFQTCLEVHLEQCGSQLPSPLYFPLGPGMVCFNRFTTSSGSRCYCCDYVLSQGSHSLRVNVLW